MNQVSQRGRAMKQREFEARIHFRLDATSLPSMDRMNLHLNCSAIGR